jgi:NAD(P)-binding Rossmann-like domain/Flavin containing amine oxidoreductase
VGFLANGGAARRLPCDRQSLGRRTPREGSGPVAALAQGSSGCTRRVAVLGAGLSGLAAAHLLASTGQASVDVLEARAIAGGRANVEDGAEHCQRLFLGDYRTLLALLEQIPLDGASSVRDHLVRMRRFVCPPTLGWIEVSHQYSMFAPEIGLAEKVRIARAGRESVLLARRLRGNTNFLGAPKNKYSMRSKLAVGRTFIRRQTAFSLPGATDEHFIGPWIRHLRSHGVTLHLSAEVERVTVHHDGVEVHTASNQDRYDAVISTLFVSSLRTLLDHSRIDHRLPLSEHAHCPCFTISFDPGEQSPRAAISALYSHEGIGVVVQPDAHRCTVLCIRSVRTDEEWVLSQITEILDLSHPIAAVRFRRNSAPDEALFIGDHVRRDRVLTERGSPRLHVAGSWTRDGYPVDSGESAILSAYGSVRDVCRSLGIEPPVRPSGGPA